MAALLSQLLSQHVPAFTVLGPPPAKFEPLAGSTPLIPGIPNGKFAVVPAWSILGSSLGSLWQQLALTRAKAKGLDRVNCFWCDRASYAEGTRLYHPE